MFRRPVPTRTPPPVLAPACGTAATAPGALTTYNVLMRLGLRSFPGLAARDPSISTGRAEMKA